MSRRRALPFEQLARDCLAGPLWWCYLRSGNAKYALRAFKALRQAGVRLSAKEQDALLAVLERQHLASANTAPPRARKTGPKSPRLLERDFYILSNIEFFRTHSTTPVDAQKPDGERRPLTLIEIFKLVARDRRMKWGAVKAIWYDEQDRLKSSC